MTQQFLSWAFTKRNENIYSQKHLYENVLGSFIPNCYKWEATFASTAAR